jgi:hypothetical protein
MYKPEFGLKVPIPQARNWTESAKNHKPELGQKVLHQATAATATSATATATAATNYNNFNSNRNPPTVA